MTDEELMQQALEVLEDSCYPRMSAKHSARYDETITILRGKLGQEKQKPYAWTYQNVYTDSWYLTWEKQTGGRNWTPLYTAPPEREWQWLTYRDLQEIMDSMKTLNSYDITDIYTAVEAKLKEKNHAS